MKNHKNGYKVRVSVINLTICSFKYHNTIFIIVSIMNNNSTI